MSHQRTTSLIRLLRKFNTQSSANPLQQQVPPTAAKEKWDLMSAVCLQRKPVISKELNEIELKVKAMMNEMELESSMKSDHEFRVIADTVRAQKMKDKSLNVDMIDDALQQTGQDFVDQGLTELKQFTPASRITKADKENNTKSTQRKLDKNLVLLIHEKLGDKSHWTMPFGKHADGETMRQTAERVLQEMSNKNIHAKFYGNAPCGFYKYKYPKSLQTESNVVGAKIFFFKAQFVDGNIQDKKLNFMWAARDELPKLLLEEYNKNVSIFLIDD